MLFHFSMYLKLKPIKADFWKCIIFIFLKDSKLFFYFCAQQHFSLKIDQAAKLTRC